MPRSDYILGSEEADYALRTLYGETPSIAEIEALRHTLESLSEEGAETLLRQLRPYAAPNTLRECSVGYDLASIAVNDEVIIHQSLGVEPSVEVDDDPEEAECDYDDDYEIVDEDYDIDDDLFESNSESATESPRPQQPTTNIEQEFEQIIRATRSQARYRPLRSRPSRGGGPMPGQEVNRPQKRLLAAVSDRGKLLCVRYEKGGDWSDATYDLGCSFDTYLIRKCPPDIAKRLIEFDSQDDYNENGYKAWEYVCEAGLRIVQI